MTEEDLGYVGEIRMFGGNYAPVGWALCNGQVLPIRGNEVLYSLIGTTYGGNGKETFALPDLQGRIPIHHNSQYGLGKTGGTETVTLKLNELPAHTHAVIANGNKYDATQNSPANNVWGYTSFTSYQKNLTSNTVQMDPNLVSVTDYNKPHYNMMPSLAISFMIATRGIYPVQD